MRTRTHSRHWQLIWTDADGVMQSIRKPLADSCRTAATEIRRRLGGRRACQKVVFQILAPCGRCEMHSLPNTGWRMRWEGGSPQVSSAARSTFSPE